MNAGATAGKERPDAISRPPGPLDLVAKLNGLVATLLFIALTAVVALQVLTRFVLHVPFIWSEEAARFLFFWVTLLGAAMSVKARRHFVLDVSRAATGGTEARSGGGGPDAVGDSGSDAGSDGYRYHARKVRPADLIPDACVLGFSLVLLVQGIGYVGVGWLRTASNSQVNMGLVYAAIPVFAALSALYAAGNLAADIRALHGGGPEGRASAPAPVSRPAGGE